MSLDRMTTVDGQVDTMGSLRPCVTGLRHAISAGHYLAAQAGSRILDCGGNAVDAGVAACVTMAVVQSDFVNVAGVAPMMIYSKQTGRVETISGLGTWPKAASAAFFMERCGAAIPEGILRTVVPAAPAAWVTALKRYGVMSFGEVARDAIVLAREGFAMYPLMAQMLHENAQSYARWPSNAAIYQPGGRAPRTGERFCQEDLGRTLQYLVDQEASRVSMGREAGLDAACDAFYRGDIANVICRYHEEHGGLLTLPDMDEFRVDVEDAVSVPFGEATIYSCGPWCQGPVMLQIMRLLDGIDLAALGHNTPAYVHRLTESIKLAFADREAFYGDPKYVDVPLDRLLSKDYADERRELISQRRALDVSVGVGDVGLAKSSLDTSSVVVLDRSGNAFCATPSDVSVDTVVIPGTGLCVSSRGSQSWVDASHPSCVAPGKRPRLTPNPMMAIKPDAYVMPMSTPGGDVQCQAMLQVFLNVEVFGMNPQQAVEAERFASYALPDSFWPHASYPNRLNLEGRFLDSAAGQLALIGHDVHLWPDWIWKAGGVCTIRADLSSGTLECGADPRRPSYAIAW